MTGAASRRSPPTTSTPSVPGRRSGVLREATEASGSTLAPRLTLYPEFALTPTRWLAEGCASPCSMIRCRRTRTATIHWCSGGERASPAAARARTRTPKGRIRPVSVGLRRSSLRTVVTMSSTKQPGG